MTSTTSAFGDALKRPPGEPAAWIDESAVAVPKNIYDVTKAASEDLCRLFWRNDGLVFSGRGNGGRRGIRRLIGGRC